MPRRELSPTELSKDETRRQPYEIVQTENERWLSDLQAAHRLVLLSRQTLPRNQVPSTVLFEHQAQTQTATVATTTATSAVAAKTNGRHVEDDAVGELYAGHCAKRANGCQRCGWCAIGRTWCSKSSEFYECR